MTLIDLDTTLAENAVTAATLDWPTIPTSVPLVTSCVMLTKVLSSRNDVCVVDHNTLLSVV